MENENMTVAENDMFEGMPADDAQAADNMSAEELADELNGESRTQGGDHADGDQAPEAQEGSKAQFEKRIRAALAGQQEKFRPHVAFAERVRGVAEGMSDDEILAAVTAHRARQMHESDPEISEKAATEIIKARTAQRVDPRIDTYTQGFRSLIEDGWDQADLHAFATDEAVRTDLENGKSFRQAATAFLRRGSTKQTAQAQNKKGVPTLRTGGVEDAYDGSRISQMSDKEFAEYSRRLEEAAMSGKKIAVR